MRTGAGSGKREAIEAGKQSNLIAASNRVKTPSDFGACYKSIFFLLLKNPREI